MEYTRKDLLGLKDLNADEINAIIQTAIPCKEIFKRAVKKLPTLRGKVVVNAFYEPSTRTRTSFEIAGKLMSADVINITASTSSVVKGESFTDTVKTLEALGADIMVVRHSSSGSAALMAKSTNARVINAGDGIHEHPTQALLDIFTIIERLGSVDGLKVCIIGDILHSRVARSNIWGLTKLGAKVVVVGPPTLMPAGLLNLGVEVSSDLEGAIKDADVINVLRIQLERQDSGLFPSLEEYNKLFGLTKQRLRYLRKDTLILHPGPANLGVEITPEVVDDPRSAIREQVSNGVAVRMAILYLLSGGKGDALAS